MVPRKAILTSGSPARRSPRNRRQSAGELFYRHFCRTTTRQFLWFRDPVRRDECQMRKGAVNREAAVRGAVDPFWRAVRRLLSRAICGCGAGRPAARCISRLSCGRTSIGLHRWCWIGSRRGRRRRLIGIIGAASAGSATRDPRFKAWLCWGVLFDLSYYDQCAIRRGADLRSWRPTAMSRRRGLISRGRSTYQARQSANDAEFVALRATIPLAAWFRPPASTP